jgi:hypothetical protein
VCVWVGGPYLLAHQIFINIIIIIIIIFYKYLKNNNVCILISTMVTDLASTSCSDRFDPGHMT